MDRAVLVCVLVQWLQIVWREECLPLRGRTCMQACAHTPWGAPLRYSCREEAAPGGLGRGVSFRGDSRWVGIAKAAGQDALVGLTKTCQLYVAELAAGC